LGARGLITGSLVVSSSERQARAGRLSRLAAMAAKFQAQLLRSPATRVEGGTDEILRNIIAERVLGLPGDVRVDKDVAFKDLPTGR
jgi:alkylation response protein AidB-like acyl-CoA dehydrogenase